MLGYRTLFDVPGRHSDAEIIALSQLQSWLRGKGLDADALAWGESTVLAPRAEGFLQQLDGGDGARSVRARIQEDNSKGRWTSTLTVHTPGDERRAPWVWLDIDGPEGAVAGIPRLARDLLEVFGDAQSGEAHLRSVPEIVTDGDVEDVARVLFDETRRRLVFVAGSDPLMPLSRWQSLLSKILHDTVGLASAYVLDAAATSALNERLGGTHGVAPGTLRTFVGRVVPGDRLDAQRHRVLTTQRILRGDARTVARVLGFRARGVALQQPLPRAAIRVDRLLERQIDELVLTQPTPGLAGSVLPPVVDQRDVDAPRAADTVVDAEPPVDDVEEPLAADQSASVVAEAEAVSALHAISRAAGLDGFSAAAADRLLDLVRRGLAAEHQHTALSGRLSALQDQVEAAQDEILELRQQLEDEQLEVAAAADELGESSRLVRHLRSLLAQTEAAAEAWTVPEVADEDVLPSTFQELLDRMDDLPGVILTMGKPDAALALDAHDPLGTWAGKTWQVLRALSDYAACKSAGLWAKDVDAYLRGGPTDRATFSATRHARDESESVKNSPKFRTARELPVPTHISASGKAFMGAHFKIAQHGLISPRLHYLDATGVDSTVYVGYVGPHLPTKKTN